MADWLGFFDFMLGAVNTSRAASDIENNRSAKSEEIGKAVKERADAIVEERIQTMKKKRCDSSQLKHQDHHRMRR